MTETETKEVLKVLYKCRDLTMNIHRELESNEHTKKENNYALSAAMNTLLYVIHSEIIAL